MSRQIFVNQATAAKRYVYFQLVDATDGMTPEVGEAGGQPQISINGAGFVDAGIGVLVAIGNGRYYAELTQATLASVGTIIETRYKSANTAECVGDQVHVIGYDPDTSIVPEYFEHSIWFDSNSGGGIDKGKSPLLPVGDVADLLTIIGTTGIRRVVIMSGTLAFASDPDLWNIYFVGIDPDATIVSAYPFQSCSFENLTVELSYADAVGQQKFYNCYILFDGCGALTASSFASCILRGTLKTGASTVVLQRCTGTSFPGEDPFTIDCDGGGYVFNHEFHGHASYIHLNEALGQTYVEHIGEGAVTVDSSDTTGTITVQGTCTVSGTTGGSTLDDQTIPAQLDDLDEETATAVRAELSTELAHIDADISSRAAQGTGTRQITIRLVDNQDPAGRVGNAVVQVWDSTNATLLHEHTTNESTGECVTALDDGTYKLRIGPPPGYSATVPETLTVTATATHTYTLTKSIIAAEPDDPSLCVISGIIRDAAGNALPGVQVRFVPTTPQATGGSSLSNKGVIATSDDDGLISLSLVRETEGTISSAELGLKNEVRTVPNAGTQAFETWA